MTINEDEVLPGPIDTSTMTRDELIAHNLKVVEAHFHNEAPETVDKAIALYGPEISWEGPNRGQHLTDPAKVREAYMGIYSTVHFNKATTLRRFATEDYVFDDQVIDMTVVGDQMPNLPFKPGDRLSMRLVHLFEMKDGQIVREIAYEMSRPYGSDLANDAIPEGAVVEEFPTGPHYGQP
ncbi:nuclear transport factor 2 family protein [Enemella evansiae]|uniref:SnoaL-like domain-containing protein n=1 Tax=Enemella evansiae TaxID=2016499 RepID=A0A255GNH0_9ACTN|nr:nuclear transport factor 2 family protein [Enemella evansiae]OYO00928.1 hypothetical protein CGZ95_10005 [Enemella evansiae]OYO14210.1 hypothetical protein BI335_13555 [Enemella evansiae]OYO17349.1 hypothetical protein CGZ94_00075 [Enemella evansiae]TDO91895.1 SnoaL-like protein [Enemella evansiae]